jgi:hypothetical protein
MTTLGMSQHTTTVAPSMIHARDPVGVCVMKMKTAQLVVVIGVIAVVIAVG